MKSNDEIRKGLEKIANELETPPKDKVREIFNESAKVFNEKIEETLKKKLK